MCGIAGFFDVCPLAPDAGALGARMAERIARRGPDDHGVWCDSDAGIVLAHRRLAVLDLSEAGHQPMTSPSGRFVIVYNGEIYNHLELRNGLEHAGKSPVWRGHSDTETLLALIDAWGLEAALQRSVGMFAMALWDRGIRRLTLARDRMGEKPLYYGWQGGTLLFGSEVAALRAHPAFEDRIDRSALANLVSYGYVPAPGSIYAGVNKLPPGWLLEVDRTSMSAGPDGARLRQYWSVVDAARRGSQSPFVGSLDDAADRLDALLSECLAGQMLSDVPLGAFLSGGIDSSLIVAKMQYASSRPIRTFTIGLEEVSLDESRFARQVAAYLGTEHMELRVTASDAVGLVTALPDIYSEPFADSSQIPTCMVARLAKQHVTVALSGDAGDELFAGYSRYFLTQSLWRRIESIPAALRGPIARALAIMPPAAITALSRPIQPLLPSDLRRPLLGDDLLKGRHFLSAGCAMDVYRAMLTFVGPGETMVRGVDPTELTTGDRGGWQPDDFVSHAMLLDAATFLPDDILTKVDRAAMAVSLETRVPLLDHRIVEFAWSLPPALRASGERGKLPLRKLLARYLPDTLTERPKMGFSIPIDRWLRGPLREWAGDLLDGIRLSEEGFLDARLVRRRWHEHLTGRRNWQFQLWSVLMFEAWLDKAKRDRGNASALP